MEAQLLRVGDDLTRATVICSRAGVLLAALPPSPMVQSAITEATETTILRDEYASVPFGGAKRLGGRIFGWMGEPLDGLEPPLLRAEAEHKEMVALFATPPSQAELREIDSSLHTGTLAIDTLTPIGRGQSMMLFGEAGTGKSAIGVDAILSQATSDVHLAIADHGDRSARGWLAVLDELVVSTLGSHDLAVR